MKDEGSICFEATPALLAFRRIAGDANRCLNTLLVGLETLKTNSPVKPTDLVVAWSKPRNLEEWIETRDFALRGAMVAVADGLDQYMRIVTRIDGLVATELGDILNGRRGRKESRRPTVFARLAALCKHYPRVACREHLIAMNLLMTWRNQFVHRDYRFGLTLAERKELAAAAPFFKSKHGGSDIEEALIRFEKREPPTLANLSTLIASAHRLVRALDEHLLSLQAGEIYAVALTRYLIASDEDPLQRLEVMFERGGWQAAGHLHALFLDNGGNHHENRRA
jgi:hypothetical protein